MLTIFVWMREFVLLLFFILNFGLLILHKVIFVQLQKNVIELRIVLVAVISRSILILRFSKPGLLNFDSRPSVNTVPFKVIEAAFIHHCWCLVEEAFRKITRDLLSQNLVKQSVILIVQSQCLNIERVLVFGLTNDRRSRQEGLLRLKWLPRLNYHLLLSFVENDVVKYFHLSLFIQFS